MLIGSDAEEKKYKKKKVNAVIIVAKRKQWEMMCEGEHISNLFFEFFLAVCLLFAPNFQLDRRHEPLSHACVRFIDHLLSSMRCHQAGIRQKEADNGTLKTEKMYTY